MKYIIVSIALLANCCYGQMGIEEANMVFKSAEENYELHSKQKAEFEEWIDGNRAFLDTCQNNRLLMLNAHKVASIKYVLEEPRDSVIHYLEIALEAHPFRACRMMIDLEKKERVNSKRFLTEEYFGKEVSQEWWDNTVSECYSQFDSIDLVVVSENTNKVEKIENLEYATILKDMEKTDQQYRKDYQVDKPYNNEGQEKLDAQNRIVMDSLYQEYGFPGINKVGESANRIAWLILQHSTDCEWNKKWVQLFIDEYIENGTIGSPLAFTITRLFDPESGFCDKELSREFLSHLGRKYTKEIAAEVGYSGYLFKSED